ncbi:TPA: winged helix-turn-helix domain-containing protein [Streptococcus agalactiae]|nr:winged helix-turn-helix domain-containing protein [Streptococcus agalactiae]
MFYLKIAWHNLKHSIDQYIPFLLASLLLYSLTCSTLLILMSAVGRDMGTAATVLFLGVIVLSIFAVVMEHYSYNILMKQRSSEFGLYNILGMNKRQVARVASLELFIIYIFLISIGSLFSAFFAKFIYLIFVNIINYHALNLSLSLWPFIICIVIFTGIFLTLEVPVIRHVHLSSPLSLFRKKQQGEKEPKGNLILAILALVAIAIAYTMALTSGKAPALAVIYRFFFAVLLVIAGTYLFYISFMTWYLKRLRQNKHYYYKSEHFVSTSQMIFRMKQNAVGLASITLLAVMALVTIATTVSLYSNTQNVVTGLFPKSVSLSIDNSKGDAKNIFEEKILKKLGKSSKEAITYNQTMISMPVSQSSELNITSKNVKHVDITKTGFMYLITQNDFRRLGHQLPKLKDNQVAYFVQKGDSRLKKINLLGNKFDVVKNLKEAYVPETTNTYNPGLIIFANNKQIDNIRKAYLPYTKNINTFPKTFKAYLDLNSQEINSISKNDIIEVDGKYVGNISTKQSFLKEGYQIKDHLSASYHVSSVSNFRDVKQEIIAFQPDLILMDITLPYFNGFYWTAELRKFLTIPIIFISSSNDEMDMVMALNMGGDDFISKPFSLAVLDAKLTAILRRSQQFIQQELTFGGFTLTREGLLSSQDKEVILSPTENKILSILLMHPKQVVSKESLLEKLWENDSFIDQNTLNVNMTRLRKKIVPIGFDYIHTVRGVGYLLQ